MNSDDYYNNCYSKVLNGGIVGFVAGLYHKKLEAERCGFYGNTLEIGAGSGEHFHFVVHKFNNYLESDVRGNSTLKKQDLNSKLGRVQDLYLDAHDLRSLPSESIDRIVVTCVFSHLVQPEIALREWRRVLKVNGVIDIYVPCEPGILLRVAQYFTTRKRVSRLGLDYNSIQYREHRNHFPMMRLLVKEVFASDEIRSMGFPFNWLPWDLKLFVVFKVTKRTNLPS